jgi:uncharacterized protein YkwD
MGSSVEQHAHEHSWGRRAAVLCCALILAVAVAMPAAARPWRPVAPCRDATLQPSPADLARIDTATLCLLNQIRSAYRLRPLRFSRPLQSVAAGQAHDMVLGDYFGDDSLSGETPMQRILTTSYPVGAVQLSTAQNIGWAVGPTATPTGMVAAWMSSPPHRAIILTPSYRDLGVGVTPAAPSSLAEGRPGATYTLELGLRVLPVSRASLRSRRASRS